MTDRFELVYPGSSSWRDRWGHCAPLLLSGSIAAAIALGIRPHAASELSLLVSVSLVAFVIATWLLMRAHDRRLCEACASAMPLNPMQEAARFKTRLRLAHQASNPYYLVPYLVVLIGSNFLTSQPGRYLWAAVQATMIYLILSNTTHRKLQPWCSWCSGDGGGEERDKQPEPDGPRGNGRQLV
jgi:hypothetical protein